MPAAVLVLLGVWVVPAAAWAGDGDRPKAADCRRGFTSYPDAVALLQTLAAGRPDLARVEILGTSVQGRAIVGLRISDNAGTNEAEPAARIIGGIHGNECMSFEVALGVARALVEDYGRDPTVTAVVDDMETLVVPMANPDGVVASTRGNARGVDLNRNFPFMWVDGVSTGLPGSEPETRALRDDGLRHPYVVGISYHTVANYINLVWNYTPVPPRHEPELRALFEPYAEGTTYEVVLGWHWYSVYGEYTDHNYGTRGTLDTIIEIQHDYGRARELGLHVPRAIALLAAARHGLEGRVTDARTGAPLAAVVWVAERWSPVYTEPELGDFHTVLVPGTYTISVWAPGYHPVTRSDVVVPAGGRSRVDVALQPGGGSFGFAVTGVRLPRPIVDPRYSNTSVPTDALGPPDGRAYNLEPGGEITIDLGVELTAHEGAELRVHAGPGGSTDRAAIEGASAIDGPWTRLGSITGTTDIDLNATGATGIRFVRIADTSGGQFGLPGAGYDLDSIEVLPPPVVANGDADADADTDGGGGVGPDVMEEVGGDEVDLADGRPNGDLHGDAADAGTTPGPDAEGEGGGATDGSQYGDGRPVGCGCNASGSEPGVWAWPLLLAAVASAAAFRAD